MRISCTPSLRQSLLFAGIISLLVIWMYACIPPAHAQEDWRIETFHANITVRENSDVLVEEIITSDFIEPSRGIFRFIPLEYVRDWGLAYRLRLRILSVTDSTGNPLPYETWIESGQRAIRIGDPETFFTGRQIYRITYVVTNGIRFFDDHDELYWNITGNEWDIPLSNVSARVQFPETDPQLLRATCFTGGYGAQTQSCTTSLQPSEAAFQSEYDVQPYEGFTLALWFPKGLLTPPTFLRQISEFLIDNWGFGIPVIVFVLLWRHYRRYGRDPKWRHAVAVEFTPPDNLTPSEMGTVLDERVDPKDISADIVHLAVHGYLTITEEKKSGWLTGMDYLFTRTEKAVDGLKQHQKDILAFLFGSKKEVKLSQLANTFYKHLKTVSDHLYEHAVKKQKYFPENPHAVRNRFLTSGIVLFIMAASSLGFFIVIERFDIWIGLVTSTALLIFFSPFMPRKTAEGAECHRKILGFRDYISTAEKYRLKFQEDRNIFEKYLPYAIIFGLAYKWGKAFEGIYREPPTWYHGTGVFSPGSFAAGMGNFTRSANTILASTPSSRGSSGSSGFSSGGGLSGGGFGGGGGRRW